MKARFSALLIASLAGLLFSGQAAASPRFLDNGYLEFSVRDDRAERDYGKREDRDMRKDNRQHGKRNERKAEDHGHDRGYGYGYERRNMQPPQDDRGRR
jgi:hypothetical protein